MTQAQKRKTSLKADRFTESAIREMTRVALQYGAVNLAQGFPDFACPSQLKRAACEAIETDINQYAITWGDRLLKLRSIQKVSQGNLRQLGIACWFAFKDFRQKESQL